MFEPIKDCWFLTGPTASGKTKVGLALAAKLNAEIISLDSMAIYREMNIGTAKPTAEETSVIPHHLIDIVEPTDDFSLANYLDAAHECAAEIRGRGKEVLFVGGTPLYLKSLLRGLFEGPPPDWEFRKQVREEAEQVGVEALHERLRMVDPLSASKLPKGDVRRIIRALEVHKATGQPISHKQLHFDEGMPADACKVFVMAWPRETQIERIDARADRMFAIGLMEEARGLRDRHAEISRTAAQAVGYRECFAVMDGELELDKAIERVKIRTRRFAKRQRTWFRGLSECRPIERHSEDTADSVSELILADLE